MRLKLLRLTVRQEIQKLGKLFAFDKHHKLFECFTLEPFDSIKPGHYDLEKYHSPKLRRTVLLFSHVEGHSFVEMHPGNFRHDTILCILPGETITDINKDGWMDVTNSNETMNKLLEVCDHETTIDIYENPLEFA